MLLRLAPLRSFALTAAPMSLLLIGWLVCAGAFADEDAWLRVNVNWSYEDSQYKCGPVSPTLVSTDGLYLNLQAVGGKLVRVTLGERSHHVEYQNFRGIISPTPMRHAEIEFTPWELSQVRLIRDKAGKLWLKSLVLTPRLAFWLMLGPRDIATVEYWRDANVSPDGAIWGQCTPRRPPWPKAGATDPELIALAFETGNIDEGIGISHSTRTKLTGVRNDGVTSHAFSAGIELVQRQHTPFKR